MKDYTDVDERLTREVARLDERRKSLEDEVYPTIDLKCGKAVNNLLIVVVVLMAICVALSIALISGG